MTREEAIKICKEVRHCLWIADEQKTTTIWDKGAVSEAMLMAIEALKREDTMLKEIERVVLYGERSEE